VLELTISFHDRSKPSYWTRKAEKAQQKRTKESNPADAKRGGASSRGPSFLVSSDNKRFPPKGKKLRPPKQMPANNTPAVLDYREK
jgi:hypothetical protein